MPGRGHSLRTPHVPNSPEFEGVSEKVPGKSNADCSRVLGDCPWTDDKCRMRVGRICVNISGMASGWLGPEGVVVSGQPLADIWASPGPTGHDRLAAHLTFPVVHPRLTSARIDRSHFDLDDLIYPVLAATRCDARESVWTGRYGRCCCEM